MRSGEIARTEVVNLSQHDLSARDLVLRRLEALTGRPVEGLEDWTLLDGPRRKVDAAANVLCDGTHRADAAVIMAGVAADVRILPDGRRQILGLRLPGDIIQGEAHDRVAALTPMELADAQPLVRELSERGDLRSSLGRAWMAAMRAEQAMLRDQIVRLGRLSAYERLAHLMLEIHERLFHVGLATASSFHMPLRQEMIADLLGLSVVHVSRTTQQLKREHLVQTRGSYVTLLDRDRLMEVASYASRFAAPPPRLQPNRIAAERRSFYGG
jgi:CRP-like cAMP-binding protein